LFSKYSAHNFGNRQTNERTDQRTRAKHNPTRLPNCQSGLAGHKNAAGN